ncbi:MAG: hypothetical protein Tsb0021_05350 [Chlamydiales bacterium]
MREGDNLLIWKLDHLGCIVNNLIDCMHELNKQEPKLKSLTDATDAVNLSGHFFFKL